MIMEIEFGLMDVWVLIPTITIDMYFKGIGIAWIKWCLDIRIARKEDRI